MRKNKHKILIALIAAITMISCRKEEKVNANLKDYAIDDPVANTPLDAWLRTTFLDEYNIETIYRYNRFYHGDDRDVASVKIENVQPQMQSVLAGFILPYRKIAGETFIKKMVPKQFVLFGSGSYEGNGSYVVGTASGGIRVTLYDVNNFDVNNPNSHVDKISVIHHEFTHILNQIVPMPEDFKNITKSSYNATWTDLDDETARDNGYVTPYASSAPGEDFAEMVKVLLVNGQAWFDAWANASTATGKAALKAKEASVVQYFNVNLRIDFRTLQKEVQNVIRNTYQWQNASFRYWLAKNAPFKTMTMNLEDKTYTDYKISPDFAAAYNQLKGSLASTYGWHLDYVQLRFASTTKLTVRVAFTQGTTQFFGDFSFSYAVNSTTGEVTFTKVANDTGTNFGYGDIFKDAFTPSIQAYLTGKTFIADWLPANISPDKFNSYAGFYQSGTPANYFYGQLGQTL
ncbi:hypothetical protein KHS38_15050 [Mucilaginibacter sp. Bleaf8]|uniref:substrate import-associated zinc metallohydrolase lipoprotein n=1 Tax=Mucilaginibacter sp. Bleaf8 TaxID=2834430 RepID=UPI001BCCD1B8|nr:substrate import-associated zinc metallohydrolase lipoprotein [Mucilaginibacter sp. Bleaf8]MBS7565727.1 hypothetical protein [Mucilaginibacter sp. Bleaf8]